MLMKTEFEKSLIDKGSSKNTISSYMSDLALFEAFCYEKGIDEDIDVAPEDITAYFDQLKKDGKSSSTIRRVRSSLNAYFIFLMKTGHAENNPLKDIHLDNSKKSAPLPPVLSYDDIDHILSYDFGNDEKGLRDRAIVELLYASGIKISSLVSMDVDAYDPDFKMIYAEDRHIPLYKSAHESLNNYIKKARPYIAQPGEKALFVNLQGTAMSRQGLWKMLKSIASDVGIDKSLSPRLLRRSFAVHMLENGAGPKDLEKMLGLSDKASVSGYIKLMKGNEVTEDYFKFHPRAKK